MRHALESTTSLVGGWILLVRGRPAFATPHGGTPHRWGSSFNDGGGNGCSGNKKPPGERFREQMNAWGFDAIQLLLTSFIVWWLVFHA